MVRIQHPTQIARGRLKPLGQVRGEPLCLSHSFAIPVLALHLHPVTLDRGIGYAFYLNKHVGNHQARHDS